MINKFLAQSFNINPMDGSPSIKLEGPLPKDKFNNVGDIVNAVVSILFPLALVAVFVYFLWAGFDIATSLGNSDKVKKAKAKMTNAVIGLALLATSYWLAQIVSKVLWK